MNTSQGSTQWPNKTDIVGTGNTVGHNNQTTVTPVTVNVSIHAVGYMTPIEHAFLERYRAANEDGRKVIERALHRAARLLLKAK